MGCTKDSGCLNIYSKIYPGLLEGINSSITSASNEINDIVATLNGLSVPDDYLGEKVKSRLADIVNSLSSDVTSLSAENSSINSFVSSKIAEHKGHYLTWKATQEMLRKKRAEQENLIDKEA